MDINHLLRMTEEITNLAIEGNSLTFDQVSDVIDGKRVLGPPKDIREAQNGYARQTESIFYIRFINGT